MTQNEAFPWLDTEDKEYIPPFSGCDVPRELFFPAIDLRIKESESTEI